MSRHAAISHRTAAAFSNRHSPCWQAALLRSVAEAEPEIKNVNLASSPSSLKITDMRYAVIVKPGPSPCVLIRIDTNQGVYGLGEVRDIAGPAVRDGAQEPPARRESSAHRLPVPEDRAVWRQRAPGGRSMRGGDGAVGHCGQGLQHSRLPDARRQMARRDPHLCRHHGVRWTRRNMAAAPKSARRWA